MQVELEEDDSIDPACVECSSWISSMGRTIQKEEGWEEMESETLIRSMKRTPHLWAVTSTGIVLQGRVDGGKEKKS